MEDIVIALYRQLAFENIQRGWIYVASVAAPIVARLCIRAS